MLVVERFRPGRRKMTERKKREKKIGGTGFFLLCGSELK